MTIKHTPRDVRGFGLANRILVIAVAAIFSFYAGMRYQRMKIEPVLNAWRQQVDNASPLVRQWRMQYEACVKSKFPQ